MKAVVVENYDSIDNIRLQDVAMPDVSAGQVRVRIQAASVGFVDGLKVQGLYQTRDPLPFTPGTEFAGIVDATAADITEFTPGTPVMGMARSGGLAEYITVPAAALEPMPVGIAPEVVNAELPANAPATAYSFNSCLQALSLAAVVTPARCIMEWELGDTGWIGYFAGSPFVEQAPSNGSFKVWPPVWAAKRRGSCCPRSTCC
mgnify:CR=1 FL=1